MPLAVATPRGIGASRSASRALSSPGTWQEEQFAAEQGHEWRRCPEFGGALGAACMCWGWIPSLWHVWPPAVPVSLVREATASPTGRPAALSQVGQAAWASPWVSPLWVCTACWWHRTSTMSWWRAPETDFGCRGSPAPRSIVQKGTQHLAVARGPGGQGGEGRHGVLQAPQASAGPGVPQSPGPDVKY